MNKPIKVQPIASHCVQCGEEMPYGTNWDKFVPVCFNHKCPNFGLLQMEIEKMKLDKIKKKT